MVKIDNLIQEYLAQKRIAVGGVVCDGHRPGAGRRATQLVCYPRLGRQSCINLSNWRIAS